MVFSIVCAGIFAAWVVIGAGHVWVASIFASAQQALQSLAVWYQSAVEGPTKLIAPAITIASGSYAIYKGYKYAGARLHYRLHDFIAREEERLKDARKQLRLIIERPNVERRFREPIFLEAPLKNAVRELGWGSYFLGPQLGYVRFQLDTSIMQLQRRVQASKERHENLQHQLATAHLLRGAMCVADADRARRKLADDRVAAITALRHFKAALQAKHDDEEALEYAAHVHVSLKQDDEAEECLNRLMRNTAGNGLSRARAYRYVSDIEAARGAKVRARRAAESALDSLPDLTGEDRIEEAEMEELVGDRQIALHAHLIAESHWQTAKSLFDDLNGPAAAEGSARSQKLAALDGLRVNNGDGNTAKMTISRNSGA